MWHPVPGSLLIEEGLCIIDESLLDALPEPLLKREFTLHERAIANGYIERADKEYIGLLSDLRIQRLAPGAERDGEDLLNSLLSGDGL
jgi:hypothetical protein